MQWPETMPEAPVNPEYETSPLEAVLPIVVISSPCRACQRTKPPKALKLWVIRCPRVAERCGLVVETLPKTATVPGAVAVASKSALKPPEMPVAATVESRPNTMIAVAELVDSPPACTSFTFNCMVEEPPCRKKRYALSVNAIVSATAVNVAD